MTLDDYDVLVACEYSGVVRDAFLRRGIKAVSCDLLPTEISGPHIQGDVRPYLKKKWKLVIAHPSCTYLCNSGVRWLHEREGRWKLMREAASFFLECLDANADHTAVENPVMHKYAKEIIGCDQAFSVQPWQFGDPAKKRTCFWTRNLPPLIPTSDMKASDARADCHLASPGPDRWKERSRTYRGIAEAIADQWGSFVFGVKPDPWLTAA